MFAAAGYSGCRLFFTIMATGIALLHNPVTIHDEGSAHPIAVKSPSNVIRKTSDYSIFKSVQGNRPLNEKHVLELVASMEEHDFHEDDPINVTLDLEVVDGQHRLEARARLGRPVYYKISKAMRPEDIAVVNSTASNWKLGDYLAYHISKGNEQYVLLKAFAEKHNILPYNAIGLLRGGSAQPGGGEVREFEKGSFFIQNLEHAERIMRYVDDFAEFFDFARAKAFINAVARVSKLAAYDHEIMIAQGRKQRDKFIKINDVRSYINLLEQVYDFGRPKNLAVNFRVA